MSQPYIFQVSGITCDGCAARITRAINRLDAHATVEIDQDQQQVKVSQTTLTRNLLAETLGNTGFPAQQT